jgi:hypothetical protein
MEVAEKENLRFIYGPLWLLISMQESAWNYEHLRFVWNRIQNRWGLLLTDAARDKAEDYFGFLFTIHDEAVKVRQFFE